MKAEARAMVTAVLMGGVIFTAHAQTTNSMTSASTSTVTAASGATAPAAGLPPGPAPVIATPSEAAAIASTTASLPPPAALPGSTVNALSGTGASNLSRPDFVKAIWVDAQGPALHSAETIKKLVADCREAGFDTIYAQVRANGDALYSTTLVPRQQNLPGNLDPLKTLLEEAKAGSKPLKVHALLVTYRVWSSIGEPGADHVAKQHPDWVTLAEDGSKSMENGETWLDPGNVAVQDHLALIATDLVKNYAVDGVQLDRIRYPELDLKKYPNGRLGTGYNQAALDRFNQEKGKTGRPAPTDADWVNWRRDQVSETVRKIREAVRAIRPNAEISVGAVTFGPPPNGREEYISKSTPYTSVLEDWVGWGEKGLVDSNVIMNFKRAEDRTTDFEGWQDFALNNKGKAKVVIGVGGWLNDPRYTVAQMLLPIFQPKADGVALYGYNDTYKDNLYDRNLTYVHPVLDGSSIEAKASAIAASVAKPLSATAPASEQTAKLESIAAAAGVTAPVSTAVAPTPAVAGASTLPQLGSSSNASMPPLSAGSTNVAGLPSLPGSTENTGAGGLPSLSAAAGQASAAGALPSLPGTSAANSLPSFPASGSTGATSMPSLSAAASGKTGAMPSLSSVPAAGASSLPSLSAGASVAAMPSLPSESNTGSSTLPPLGSSAVPTPVGSMPSLGSVAASGPVTAMPGLPKTDTTIASAPGLPSLSAPALPSMGEAPSVAVPSITPEAQKVVPQSPDLVSPIAPSNPVGIPEPGTTLPAAPAGIVPPTANASVTIEPPMGTPITSIAPIPSGPPTTSFSVPGTTAKTSVNIPSLGGSTNFDGRPIASAAPASPLITPPTVLTPAPGQTNEGQPVNVAKQTVMDAPKVQRMDYSERASAYGTPNPATEIRNYTTANIRKEKSDVIAMPYAPGPLELIVLKTGKEFAGRVLQRGAVWRIQLPNGSILNISGEKIASTRSTESGQMTAGITPIPL